MSLKYESLLMFRQLYLIFYDKYRLITVFYYYVGDFYLDIFKNSLTRKYLDADSE